MSFTPTAASTFVLFVLVIILQLPLQQRKVIGQKSAVTSKQNSPGNRKPNFVIILIDDMGWADVGCNGSTFYQTPNIDKLAAQSVQFKNAYAAAPVCSPTRAALLTGRYPARLQITDWLPGRPDATNQKLLRANLKSALPLEETTLPEALKESGYVSAHIGKWHLGETGFGPLEQGFDVNIGGDHTGTPASYFYPYSNEAFPKWKIPGLEGGQPGEYLTDRLTKEAEHFMEQNKSRPFLLYLAHFAVHIPMKAKEELIKKYQASANANTPQHNPIYAAMVQSVDESVGRIVKKIKELNLDDNTVLIFTSDNGGLSVEEGPNTPATSNAPLKGGKGYLYEGGIRVPLIIRSPAKTNKQFINYDPVSSIDLYPTILEMAGIKPVGKKIIDGKSLLPLLQQQSMPARNLYWHYPHYSNQGGKPGWAVRQGDYKLIEFFGEGDAELYNIRTDAGEKKNVAEQLPQKANILKKQLHAWGKEVGAQMMKPNPDYKKSAAVKSLLNPGEKIE